MQWGWIGDFGSTGLKVPPVSAKTPGRETQPTTSGLEVSKFHVLSCARQVQQLGFSRTPAWHCFYRG